MGLQQQKNLVFEMQHKMQLAMSSQQQRSGDSRSEHFMSNDNFVENQNVSSNRRQWNKSPVHSVLPTHSTQKPTESLSTPLNKNNKYGMTPTPSKTRLSFSSSGNRKSQSGLHRNSSSR